MGQKMKLLKYAPVFVMIADLESLLKSISNNIAALWRLSHETDCPRFWYMVWGIKEMQPRPFLLKTSKFGGRSS